jgi:hypothetical protein
MLIGAYLHISTGNGCFLAMSAFASDRRGYPPACIDERTLAHEGPLHSRLMQRSESRTRK